MCINLEARITKTRESQILEDRRRHQPTANPEECNEILWKMNSALERRLSDRHTFISFHGVPLR